MTGRAEFYQRFAQRFHAGKRLRPATEAQVQAAESALCVQWPDAYRQFALSCGAVYAPSILDLVVARKSGFADAQQFLTPRQSVTETRRWNLGSAGGCVVFAYDCAGNIFAFRDLPASPPRLDDAAVWFYDHEEDTVTVESRSFDEWLDRFLSL
jgi:hypothetical protein